MRLTLLFDLDGTLTDSAPGITRCIAYALETHGLPRASEDRLRACVGPPLHDSFLDLSGDPAAVEPLITSYRERYVEVGMFENEIYAGVLELLSALEAAGAALHVVTSKPEVHAERVLEHFDLRGHFGSVHGSRLDGTRAAKRELIAAARSHLELDPRSTVMVGDRGVDMSAARSGGLGAWGVRWGYGSAEELLEAGAQALLDAPGQILARWSGSAAE